MSTPAAYCTPLFAVARTIGWVAHWNEMIADPDTKIVRPRQLYVGRAHGRSFPRKRAPSTRRWSAEDGDGGRIAGSAIARPACAAPVRPSACSGLH